MGSEYKFAGASDILTLENATAVPFGAGERKGMRRPAGVFDAGGNWIEQAQCLRAGRYPITVPPEGGMPEGPFDKLEGRWLFGGMLYQHFGHFLVESTSRLWAVDHLDEAVDGILFFPRRQLTWPRRFVRPVLPWLAQYGTEFANVEAPATPVVVDELIVPPQAFGTGDMMAGSPEYRDFVSARLGRGIEAEGAKKIYLSRSGLNSKRGRYLGEEAIEEFMAGQGYRIYHPQTESLEQQIAQYKAARVIVSSDNSALHLAAFFLEPDDRLAIILRRPGNIIDDFRRQLSGFSGLEPDIIDSMDGRLFHFGEKGSTQPSEVYAVLDPEFLGEELAERGYVRSGTGAPLITEDAMMAELERYREAMGEETITLVE